jgi:hydroxyacylglutathione hydrolase
MIGAGAITVERIVAGQWDQNCYLVSGGGDAVVVDPGGDAERIAEHLAKRDLNPLALLVTHGHHDHLGAAAELSEMADVRVHMHSADARVLRRANFYRTLGGESPIRIPPIDVDLAGSSQLRFSSLEIGVLHTPGHTPGGVCFEIGDQLFTGDTIFADHVGRTDLPEGDRAALESSLRILAERCSPQTTIRPGHGEPAVLADIWPRVATMAELR